MVSGFSQHVYSPVDFPNFIVHGTLLQNGDKVQSFVCAPSLGAFLEVSLNFAWTQTRLQLGFLIGFLQWIENFNVNLTPPRHVQWRIIWVDCVQALQETKHVCWVEGVRKRAEWEAWAAWVRV